MSTGFIIKQLRLAEGVTQGFLAEKLGISRVYLSQVERGRLQPGLNLLKSVSQECKIPLPLLFAYDQDCQSPIFESLQGILTDLLLAKRELRTARVAKK